MCSGKVPVMQNMASAHEKQSVDSKDDSGLMPAVSSDKSGVEAADKSGVEACNSNTQCNNNDITCDSKWKFRPPPRGLTPNEYVLCHG